MGAVHSLTTRLTADELEARDTEVEPLVFPLRLNIYTPGDGVVLTSKDGATFLGEIADVESWNGVFYVELT